MTLLNSKNGQFFVSKEKKFYGISYRIETFRGTLVRRGTLVEKHWDRGTCREGQEDWCQTDLNYS